MQKDAGCRQYCTYLATIGGWSTPYTEYLLR